MRTAKLWVRCFALLTLCVWVCVFCALVSKRSWFGFYYRSVCRSAEEHIDMQRVRLLLNCVRSFLGSVFTNHKGAYTHTRLYFCLPEHWHVNMITNNCCDSLDLRRSEFDGLPSSFHQGGCVRWEWETSKCTPCVCVYVNTVYVYTCVQYKHILIMSLL